ncbi:EamA family transporter [Bifidobacterium sp. CP2]|uniref:EamA family transporter n=1 Tax=Bifidobacterium sp. CP2 TaxID=2809025 RepID=UPI001BDC0C76|nr:EamA family transporter [Bifidobacterium sp. CP2]MBT1180628.1 EamA family transporter [Bifidobacterium sp. CP2]
MSQGRVTADAADDGTHSPQHVIQTPKGVAATLAQAFVYGMFPLYWAALATVPSMNVMLYRIVTAAAVMILFMLLTRRWRGFVAAVQAMWHEPRIFWAEVAAAVLVTIDWVVYIRLVAVGRTSEASAANFLMPLINMALALIILRERTTRLGLVSMAIALAGGALYVLDTGAFPGLALLMTVSYSGYCLIKRFIPLDPFQSLTFETGVLAPFAFAALAVQPRFGVPAGEPWWVWALLGGCGLLTAVPLVLTSYGVRHAAFLTLSFTQYITPTIQLVLGIMVLGEHVPAHRFISFSVIWLALAVYTFDLARRHLERPKRPKRP